MSCIIGHRILSAKINNICKMHEFNHASVTRQLFVFLVKSDEKIT